MIRFFAVHHDPMNGTHLHNVLSSNARTMNDALADLRAYRQPTAPHQRPVLFYDFGTGDSDLRRLDKVTAETF